MHKVSSMKILLLIRHENEMAGSTRNAANMTKALQDAGVDVRVLAHSGRTVRFVFTALREARKCDIVQAVDVNPLGIIGFVITRFISAKLVIVAQASYSLAPLDHLKTRALSLMTYHGADRIVAGSKYVADEIERRVGDVHVDVIDPGIDMQTFRGAGVARAVDEQPFILSVGAIKARKGHDVSMHAFALAKKKIPTLRYVIVGSQTDEPRFFASVATLADELGVRDSVEFLSNVSDDVLNDLYARAALFILTSSNVGSHIEGFGMVFLEAAAYGVPSVGTLGNGIEGAVENGRTGILVPQNDPEAAAAAIVKIISDSTLAERMSMQAKVFASEHDIPHLSALYSTLYRGMLDR